MNHDLEMEALNCGPEKLYSDLHQEVMSCSKCDLGCGGKLDDQDVHVMGRGSDVSGVMFVAEAPGLNETIHKRPLTPPGLSGKIYEKVLRQLGLDREVVYTTNTVLCRPPKNRDPEPWELHKCRPYLERQIGFINPKIVVTFGRFAAQVFLGTIRITKDHGQIRRSEKFGVDVFPLYHPAYIGAYAPKEKREEFKQDVYKLQELLKEYGVPDAVVSFYDSISRNA